MKKMYEKPVMEIFEVNAEDVIVCSFEDDFLEEGETIDIVIYGQ